MLSTDKEFCSVLKNALKDCVSVRETSQWRTINDNNSFENPLYKTKTLCKYYENIFEIKCNSKEPRQSQPQKGVCESGEKNVP